MQFAREFIKNHFYYGVARSSATLAYYLMFSMFPLLMFLNSLLGLINISPEQIENYILILPDEVQSLILDYLGHLSNQGNIMPLILGLGLVLYSFTRCINNLSYSINKIFDTYEPHRNFMTSLFFTLSFMISVYLMLVLVVSGGTILNFAGKFVEITPGFVILYNRLRYFLTISYFCMFIMTIYMFLPSKRMKFTQVIPGTLYAIVGLVAISVGFSYYVENFANYGVVYGSLSAIIVLMMWLYMSGSVIVQGCIINKMLLNSKKTLDN